MNAPRVIRPSFLSLAIKATIAGAFFLPQGVTAQQVTVEQSRSWSIPKGSLATALDQYARQADVSLSYAADALEGKNTSGVSGTYSSLEALNILLQGSGLQVQQQSPDSYTLLPAAMGNALELGATNVSSRTMLGGTTEGTASYTTGAISIGKTPQSLRRTPQSVTVLTSQRLEDQNLTNLTQMLDQTPGVVVDYFDSERVRYYTRGYQIDKIQYDGATIEQGAGGGSFIQTDAAIIDHVEVLRGASGMLRGAGEPSGTVNMVRKRPTREFHGSGSVTAGRWDAYRYVADLSGPLAADGALRGRIIAVHDDRDLFQDGRMERKNVLYGVLAADLTDRTTITTGLEYTELEATGAWGNLPADFDGSALDLPRDTFLGAHWARWDRNNLQAFAELEHRFDNDWNLKLTGTRSRFRYENEGFKQTYMTRNANAAALGNPYLMDFQVTEGDGGDGSTQTNLSAVLDGPFSLLGREHHLTVGAERIHSDTDSLPTNRIFPWITGVDIRDWDPYAVAEPEIDVTAEPNRTEITQDAIYANWRISLTDPLTAVIGARLNWWDYEQKNGTTGIVTPYKVTREVVPYGALIYDLTDNISAYGSYTEIFKPQDEYNASGSLLDPLTGEVYELGLKGEFYDGRLNTSFAVFRTNQTGKALDDVSGPNPCPPNYATGYCKVASGKTRSEGFELEISGEVLPGWQVAGGYTYTTTEYLKDTLSNTGNALRTTDPKRILRLFSSYRLPGELSAWTVGGGVQAQSDIYAVSGTARAEQSGYAVYSAMLNYRFDDHYTLQLNANNLFDKEYYKKIGATGVSYYYGEPRNLSLTLRGEF